MSSCHEYMESLGQAVKNYTCTCIYMYVPDIHNKYLQGSTVACFALSRRKRWKSHWLKEAIPLFALWRLLKRTTEPFKQMEETSREWSTTITCLACPSLIYPLTRQVSLTKWRRVHTNTNTIHCTGCSTGTSHQSWSILQALQSSRKRVSPARLAACTVDINSTNSQLLCYFRRSNEESSRCEWRNQATRGRS